VKPLFMIEGRARAVWRAEELARLESQLAWQI